MTDAKMMQEALDDAEMTILAYDEVEFEPDVTVSGKTLVTLYRFVKTHQAALSQQPAAVDVGSDLNVYLEKAGDLKNRMVLETGLNREVVQAWFSAILGLAFDAKQCGKNADRETYLWMQEQVESLRYDLMHTMAERDTLRTALSRPSQAQQGDGWQRDFLATFGCLRDSHKTAADWQEAMTLFRNRHIAAPQPASEA